MESLPRRLFNPLSSVIAKPPSPPMTILVIVCRLFSSPIPKGNFIRSEVPLKSKCCNFLSFEKLLGNLVKLEQLKMISVCRLKRLPMFSGNSLMSVRDKLRYVKCFKLPI
ncbi:hypothetical protein Hanom_Chr04g00283181 [Helianthus anomalus]